MKNLNKLLLAILILTIAVGCKDTLDTVPEGSTITEQQKKDGVAANPELLAADIAAMNADMIGYMSILGDGFHNDFGFAAACLMMDSNGADMTCANIGYNWFGPNASYADRVYNSTRTLFMWKVFYKQIESANKVLRIVDATATDAKLKAYRGQALAIRAFDYFNLAQLHQFTYKGHETKLCVPIVTEKTTVEEAINNPRATVEAVYALIMADLNEAIELLDGYTRIDKGYVNQAVAYGLRARVNLVMNKWAEAAADADKAIGLSGATPYTLTDLAKPKFWDANDSPVMWANIITKTNSIVTSGIINMPSHLCSFYTDGYVGVGAWKKINKPLFDKISGDDVRKGWWLDAKKESPIVADASFDAWKKTASEDKDFGAYTNVKFGSDEDNLATLVPAQDWFLMRVEEMLLIKAEGLAMSGNVGEAKTTLESFIKTNRNTAYVCTAATPEDVQNEIWFQRRIELWGEGVSFFDIMRLKKPVNRVEGGVSSFPVAWKFNIDAEDPILLWLVPKSEIEANKGIKEEDNNAKVDPPKAS